MPPAYNRTASEGSRDAQDCGGGYSDIDMLFSGNGYFRKDGTRYSDPGRMP